MSSKFLKNAFFQGRLFSYNDTHRHRLGANWDQIPVNCPYRWVTITIIVVWVIFILLMIFCNYEKADPILNQQSWSSKLSEGWTDDGVWKPGGKNHHHWHRYPFFVDHFLETIGDITYIISCSLTKDLHQHCHENVFWRRERPTTSPTPSPDQTSTRNGLLTGDFPISSLRSSSSYTYMWLLSTSYHV